MLKYFELESTGPANEPLIKVVRPSKEFVKEAADDNLHPEIAKFVSGLTADTSKLYVLVNALGAGEYYGSNSNGDYFQEEDLIKEAADSGYKTFLNAGVYRHHKNKDPKKSIGKVAFVVYNKRMHRVELVLEIDRGKAKLLGHGDLVKRLDDGQTPAASMGCKVKFDVCSICGNKAKTKANYCKCITELGMNHIKKDGQKVFVLNPNPRFFDISIVIFNADKISRAMSKLASAASLVESSADRAKRYNLQDTNSVAAAARLKIAEILKEVPTLLKKIIPGSNEKTIPKKKLQKVATLASFSDILQNTAALGIVLKPEEFQRLALEQLGRTKLANALDRKHQIFRPVQEIDRGLLTNAESFDLSPQLLTEFQEYISARSAFEPFISKRVLTKEAADNTLAHSRGARLPIKSTELDSISAAYNGYRVDLLEHASSIAGAAQNSLDVQTIFAEDLLEDCLLGRTKLAGFGGAGAALLGLFPLAYLYGAYVKEKRAAGEKISATEGFIEQHPVFSASMAMGLGRLGIQLAKDGKMQKGLAKAVKAIF